MHHHILLLLISKYFGRTLFYCPNALSISARLWYSKYYNHQYWSLKTRRSYHLHAHAMATTWNNILHFIIILMRIQSGSSLKCHPQYPPQTVSILVATMWATYIGDVLNILHVINIPTYIFCYQLIRWRKKDAMILEKIMRFKRLLF